MCVFRSCLSWYDVSAVLEGEIGLVWGKNIGEGTRSPNLRRTPSTDDWKTWATHLSSLGLCFLTLEGG